MSFSTKLVISIPLLLLLIQFLQDPTSDVELLLKEWRKIPINNETEPVVHFKEEEEEEEVELVIALVSCGESRLEETTTVIKSVLIFEDPSTTEPIHFLIFADEIRRNLTEILEAWQKTRNFTFKIILPVYPNHERIESMKTAFAPCATLRLFFPEILREYRRILYIDTDVVFTISPTKIWNHFELMNGDQLAALVPENITPGMSYSEYSLLPGPNNGLNSGVMLMDLEKMRNFGWVKRVVLLYKQMNRRLVFCDQDILNLMFYLSPEKLYYLPCSYNFRPDYCLSPESSCPLEEVKKGIVLHGSRNSFHRSSAVSNAWNEFSSIIKFQLRNVNVLLYAFKIRNVKTEQRIFRSVYRTVRNFDFLRERSRDLVSNLTLSLEVIDSDLCLNYKEKIYEPFVNLLL